MKDSEGKDVVQPDAMLNANEAVRSVSIGAKRDEILIGCVSRSGFFHAFEFDPASKRKKNKAIRAKISVKVSHVLNISFS